MCVKPQSLIPASLRASGARFSFRREPILHDTTLSQDQPQVAAVSLQTETVIPRILDLSWAFRCRVAHLAAGFSGPVGKECTIFFCVTNSVPLQHSVSHKIGEGPHQVIKPRDREYVISFFLGQRNLPILFGCSGFLSLLSPGV